ncbi:MAG TPA: hypothetical protein VFW00_02830, partial [Rhodocyclaceae bacterium]|nr:hypothetical protein [Rhodocyclaceae bacterium]
MSGPIQHKKKKCVITAVFASVLAICLALLAGCGSVPIIVPDMAMPSSRTVQIQGAHGPLSKQQSQAILAKLKSSDEGTTTFQRHLALEQALVGTPLVAGNKVTLLLDGAATYPSMLSAIRNAKDNIDMESYIFDDDEVGHEFAAALIERQLAGVQINLIYDSVGALGDSKDFFKALADCGINVLEF